MNEHLESDFNEIMVKKEIPYGCWQDYCLERDAVVDILFLCRLQGSLYSMLKAGCITRLFTSINKIRRILCTE